VRVWAPYVLLVAGAAISTLGLYRAVALYSRFFRTRNRPDDGKARAAARLELAYSASIEAVVTGVGVEATLIGLFLLDHQLPWWILLGPLAMWLAAANSFVTLRYLRRRARGPS